MKAKVYIPMIIAAGAAAGLTLGLINMGAGKEKTQDELPTEIAEETTLSEEELAKQEAQKEKEYEDKVKEEEENAEKFFKKRQEEKQKKEAEEKKKAEEEKKKKEEEEKQKESQTETEEDTESAEDESKEASRESDDDVEYIYLPVDNNSAGSYDNYPNTAAAPSPAPTQHTHSWKAVYRTVHHNAQTHNEKKEIGTVEYTECLYNGELFFALTTEYSESSFYQVCKLANGDLVSETNEENEKKEISDFMDLMNISSEDEAYTFTTKVEEITDDVTVTDKEAYDEEVFDHYICTGCGQTSY